MNADIAPGFRGAEWSCVTDSGAEWTGRMAVLDKAMTPRPCLP